MPVQLSSSEFEDVIEEAQRLYALEVDDIYEALGRGLTFGVADQGPSYYIGLAQAWIKDRHKEIRVGVCGSEFVRSNHGKTVSDLLSACVVVLAKYFHQPAELAAVAAFVVKQGLESWCGEYWS